MNTQPAYNFLDDILFGATEEQQEQIEWFIDCYQRIFRVPLTEQQEEDIRQVALNACIECNKFIGPSSPESCKFFQLVLEPMSETVKNTKS